MRSAAARSAPNYHDNRLSLIIRDGLSFWYYMSGRLDDLREELEGLDGVFTEGYWGYINAPPMVYARARFRAGLGPDPMAEDEGEEVSSSPEPAPASSPYAPQPSLDDDAEVELPPGPGMLLYGVTLTAAAALLAYFAMDAGWGFPAWLGVFILGVSGVSVIVGVARQGQEAG